MLTGPYKRFLMAHNVNYADTDYKANGGKGFAKNTEFREYTGFTAPFDIAGTAFLILRYDDPRKADDSWAYIPSLRRVRRISVEVKSGLPAGYRPYARGLLRLQRSPDGARLGVRRHDQHPGRGALA